MKLYQCNCLFGLKFSVFFHSIMSSLKIANELTELYFINLLHLIDFYGNRLLENEIENLGLSIF